MENKEIISKELLDAILFVQNGLVTEIYFKSSKKKNIHVPPNYIIVEYQGNVIDADGSVENLYLTKNLNDLIVEAKKWLTNEDNNLSVHVATRVDGISLQLNHTFKSHSLYTDFSEDNECEIVLRACQWLLDNGSR